MTVISLPIPPTSNNLFPTGKHGKRYRSKEYENWIQEAGWVLASQRPPQWQQTVSILLEVRNPPTRRREDLESRAKATMDLLVKHQVIADDSHLYLRELILRWADIDGVRVTIRPWIG